MVGCHLSDLRLSEEATMAQTAVDYEQMRHDLITGYIKEEMSKFEQHPLEINSIIASFVGNILVRLDIVNEQDLLNQNGADYIKDNGTLILSNFDGLFNFGSSFCIKEAITFINIECIYPGDGSAIGILSNFDQLKSGQWVADMDGYKYYWCNGKIFGEKDYTDIVSPSPAPDWGSGDIIGLEIDCVQWVVTFYFNYKEQHKISIEPQEYYFVLGIYDSAAISPSPAQYRLL